MAGVVTGPFWIEAAQGTGRVLAAPLHWGGREWGTAAGVSVVTLGAMTQDEAVRDWTQSHRSRGGDDVALLGNDLGNGGYVFPGLGVLALGGWLTGATRLEQASVRGVENGLVASGLFNTAVKFLAHRHRPGTGDPASAWDGPSLDNTSSHMSFASGHTSLAFSVAAAFAGEYAQPWAAPLAYGLATVTAFARVEVNAHWTSDALFGAAVGYFASRALDSDAAGRPAAVTIGPWRGGSGLVLAAGF